VQNLNQSTGKPEHGFDLAIARPGALRQVENGGGRHREAGQGSAEGAGLVLFKTSPEQQLQQVGSYWENGSKTISFDKPSQRIKRLKRLKSGVWLSGQLQQMPRDGSRTSQAHFVTLTYANEGAWRPNHIAEAIDRFRHWCKRRGIECRYTWVAELTAKGRVHYHLVAWLPKGMKMTFWDRPRRVKGRKTCAFWPHGMSNTQTAKHGVAYLMKYLSKMGEFHEFPNGLRLYGTGGLTYESRQIRAWQNLPYWVKCNHGVGEVKRCGRYLVDQVTGELLPPMYRRKFEPGCVQIFQLREMPEKIFDHGAFCSYPRPASG
jgi:hypothetical protein